MSINTSGKRKKQVGNDLAGQNGQNTQVSEITKRRGLQRLRDSENPDDPDDTDDIYESEKIPSSPRTKEIGDSLPSTNLSLLEYTRVVAGGAPIDPTAYDEAWRSTTWEFTRLMKRHPRLQGLTASQAEDIIPWRVTGFEEEEVEQVIDEWDRVLYMAGDGPLDKAVALAIKYPLVADRNLVRTFARYRDFVSVAGWLQVVIGEASPVYLPVHKLAGILDCSPQLVGILRRRAIRDGYLTVVKAHTQHTATRFSFAVEKCPILTKGQQ